MNEQPTSKPPKIKLSLIVLVVVAGLLVAANGWQVLQLQDLTDKQSALEARLADQQEHPDDPNNTGWNTVITSGNGGFRVTLPDGWGPVLNDVNGDYLTLTGMTQPTIKIGEKVVVTDVEGHGGDGANLFTIVLLDKGGAAPPQGTAEEFIIKGDEELEGTKYTYIYPEDGFAGIGIPRFMGDRDYEYVIPVGDNELHVYYSVYGSDPRNLSETVDEIVRSLNLAGE